LNVFFTSIEKKLRENGVARCENLVVRDKINGAVPISFDHGTNTAPNIIIIIIITINEFKQVLNKTSVQRP